MAHQRHLSLLEWAFAIDLLDPATMGSVARTLTAMRATLTEPWLVALLALAAIALLYHAIVRRRMADSVGEAAAMTAMILAGLWIITNPAGTVGEINRALNQTGLGAVAAVSAADPTPAAPRSATDCERSSPPPSRARGATWSSATSTGVATRGAWTRA